MNEKLKNYEISAVNLLRSSSSGILSTLSKSFKGYPFGSYVTFITGPDRSIYIYASTLAQHTKNLFQDSRACITLSKEKKDDDIAKGIVKFLVDVYDDEGETVMLGTILTMVKKINQK